MTLNKRRDAISFFLLANLWMCWVSPTVTDAQITDCNGNGVEDATDISSGTSTDCNTDGIPDDCQLDTDMDGAIDDCDRDDDNDGVGDGADQFPLDPTQCSDSEGDGCDDCSSGSFDITNDGPDNDGDGLCDSGDLDDDNDGIPDTEDANPNNSSICGDSDSDGCDDCAVQGTSAPANDGLDTDSDGLCDAGDPDDDNDMVADGGDSAPLDNTLCRDVDMDGCDDCSSGTDAPASDGTDTDSDGLCDAGDPDDDNDTVADGADSAPLNANSCRDLDLDGCDDCSSGTDAPNNDGTDTDDDGLCDGGVEFLISQVGQDFDGEASGDWSGYSVSLSADGSRVAIGSPFNDSNGPDSDSGHVRLYDYDGTNWTQVGQDIDGEAEFDISGFSVSLSADCSRVAIGARFNDGNGNVSGHVRLYEYDGTTMMWTQVGQDIDGEAEYDQSGFSVSLSADGSRVAIGSPFNDSNGPDSDSGHVRIYDLVGTPFGDDDDDNDGVADADDAAPLNANACRDADGDGCDDCSSGIDNPTSDGLDTDGDGQCNVGDPDDDNDGALDDADSDDNNANVCSDTDMDGCDDCSSGMYDVSNDGTDFDNDGFCDAGDPDDDNDGALDGVDSNDANINVCSDTDGDGCDDCSSGTFDVTDDGLDTDSDGLCDAGDPDIDNDTIPNACDADVHGDGVVEGTDCNTNGIEDSCDLAESVSQDCNSNSIPDDCEMIDTDVYVGFAPVDGTENFATVLDAYRAVCPGGTVHVALGGYPGEVIISEADAKDGITIEGMGRGTVFTAGFRTTHSAAVNGLTLRNLRIRHGDATDGEGCLRMDNTGSITDLTLDGVIFDGDGIPGLHGFLGQGIRGTFTVTGCTFENINNSAVLDSAYVGGAGDAGLTAFVFTDNTVRNNEGSIALRGCQDPANRTLSATITGNSITDMNGNYPGGASDFDMDGTADDLGLAGLEVNNVESATISGNTVSDMRNGYTLLGTGAMGDPASGVVSAPNLGGIAFKILEVNLLDLSGNTISNNYQGVKVLADQQGRDIPGGSVSDNDFTGNGYAIYVVADPNDPTPAIKLSASCNYYGNDNGPLYVGQNDDTSLGQTYGDEIIGHITYGPWRMGLAGGECNGGDCDGNGVYDYDEIASGATSDCDMNGINDLCETDTDSDGIIDACDPDDDNDTVADGDDRAPINSNV